MTIPHDLQCEIHLILETAAPERYAELIAFLVNTAFQLSIGERHKLLQMNLRDVDAQPVRLTMQRYQISWPILDQWKLKIARSPSAEDLQSGSQVWDKVEDSNSEYCLASVDSRPDHKIANVTLKHLDS